MSTTNRNIFAAAVALLTAFFLAAPVSAEDEPGSRISGYVSFDANTNFMSYGNDVWQAGNFRDLLFQPSFGVEWDLGNGFSLNTGIWMDINDNAVSSIGGAGIQEVDVWLGMGYGWGDFSVGVTYQEWMYAGASERIFDAYFGYDTFLNPSLTIHTRISGGVDSKGDGDTLGAVFVFGIEEGFDAGPVSLSFPIGLALLTNNFYVAGQGGFGYFSAGVQASTPIGFIPAAYGDWAFVIGGTYYHTSATTIGNREDNIFNGNFGISVGF